MLVNQFATGGIGTHVDVSVTPIITTSVRALVQRRELLRRGEFHPGERIPEIPSVAPSTFRVDRCGLCSAASREARSRTG